MTKAHLDYYINYGGELSEMESWRAQMPWHFCAVVDHLITHRIGA